MANQDEVKNKATEVEVARESYREYLIRNRMFFTKERNVILEAVLNRDDHFSVDELLYDMQSQQLRVSRATLYRALSQLVDAGILVEADFGHGHIHYERVGGEPHEHLICVKCGKVREVQSPDLIQLVHDLAQNEGLKYVNQKTQIFVECPQDEEGNCKKSN